MSWNVAELMKKDKEFWESLRKWDVVAMMETWIEEKEWKKVKNRLPGGFVRGIQMARRKYRKGRAIGGMIMGIKKKI